MVDRMQLATDERRDFADFLDTLTPDEWLSPSLCDEWTVRDVVAHVVSYDELGWTGLAMAFVRGGFGPGRVNQLRVDAYRNHEPEQLVEVLRSHLRPRGLTAGFGGGIGLSDCLIHQQDIRRPLGRPRDVPSERVVESLEMSLRAPVVPSKRNAAGLRLVATDTDWRHGSGTEVHGPVEGILMALAGRADALGDLDGPGMEILRQRVLPPSSAA